MNINKYMGIHKALVDRGDYKCKVCDGGKYDCPGCGDQILTDEKRDDCCVCHGHLHITCTTCNGTGQHRNTGELLAEIAGLLLGDAMGAYLENKVSKLNGDGMDLIYHSDGDLDLNMYNDDVENTFEDYLAQAFIKLFDLCGHFNIKDLNILRSERNPNHVIANALLDLSSFVFTIYGIIKWPPIDPTGVIRTKIEWWLSDLLSFCEEHQIPIEKHIDARLQYEGIAV